MAHLLTPPPVEALSVAHGVPSHAIAVCLGKACVDQRGAVSQQRAERLARVVSVANEVHNVQPVICDRMPRDCHVILMHRVEGAKVSTHAHGLVVGLVAGFVAGLVAGLVSGHQLGGRGGRLGEGGGTAQAGAVGGDLAKRKAKV